MIDFTSLYAAWVYPANINGNLGLTATVPEYVSGALPEGVYTFTITAQGLAQSQTTDFTWTLDYLCNNRVCPTISPITYTITDAATPVDFSSLIVNGCTLNWAVSISPTPTSSAFITFPTSGAPSLEIEWNTNLVPASEFDTVAEPYESDYTVTLTGTNADPFTFDCTFDLTIDTPCDSITFTDPGQTDLTDTYSGTTQYF